MARVAVIGAGAIGGTVAAWLAQSHDVTLCARSPLDDLEVETPEGLIRAAPHILTDPAAAQPVDWVLAATKTYDAAGAAAWLPGLMTPTTRLAVLQNGVEHRARFRGKVPDAYVLPAIVDIPAERHAPGRILQRRNGTILVPEGVAGEGFAALFVDTPIAVSTTGDFTTAAWRKLAINCAGIVNALTLRTAEVVRDEGVAGVIRALVLECCAVGRAEGADMPDTVADQVVAQMRASDGASMNSLHADRVAGRPMELDARNGVIVRLGERHAIATPMNRALAALLAAAAG